VVEAGGRARQVDESRSGFRMKGYTMKIMKTKKKERHGEKGLHWGAALGIGKQTTTIDDETKLYIATLYIDQ
jgi:hypothetical protein